MSGVSQTVRDSRIGPCSLEKILSRGLILLDSGDGPVWHPGNKSSREWGSFLSVWVFLYGLGLNFDRSEMIHINIHQHIKEMMTN